MNAANSYSLASPRFLTTILDFATFGLFSRLFGSSVGFLGRDPFDIFVYGRENEEGSSGIWSRW